MARADRSRPNYFVKSSCPSRLASFAPAEATHTRPTQDQIAFPAKQNADTELGATTDLTRLPHHTASIPMKACSAELSRLQTRSPP